MMVRTYAISRLLRDYDDDLCANQNIEITTHCWKKAGSQHRINLSHGPRVELYIQEALSLIVLIRVQVQPVAVTMPPSFCSLSPLRRSWVLKSLVSSTLARSHIRVFNSMPVAFRRDRDSYTALR